MSALGNFLDSWLFTVILGIIILYIVLHMISREFFGKPIGAVMMDAFGRRPLKLEDIDAMAHSRLVEESRDAAKLSWDGVSRNLYLVPDDESHYTSVRGYHFVGVIKGNANYHSHIEIVFRKPWRLKKWILISPPDLLVSSPSSRNVLLKAISLKVLATDFCYPIPPDGYHMDEDKIDHYAMLIYETKITQSSNAMLVNLAETMLLKSGSDKAEVQLQREAIRHQIFKSEGETLAPEQKPEQPKSFL